MRTGQIANSGEAVEFLHAFAPVLNASVRAAHTDWGLLLQESPERTAGLSTTLRARYIHDRTVHHLGRAETAGECQGLRLRKIRGLYVVILSDRLMLKLKKLDVTLRSQNIRTGQTTAFDEQTALLGEDFGVVTNATSGYVLDQLGSEIVRVVVVCWDGPVKQWEVDLMDDAGADGVVVTIPAEPAPSAPSRTRVVAEAPGASEQSSAE
jgi:hypothetical protein